MDILEIYDDLGATPRTYHWFGLTVKTVQTGKVTVKRWEDDANLYVKYDTPVGVLRETCRKTVGGVAQYHTEYPVKDVKDLATMAYVLERQTFDFDRQRFDEYDELIGDRAAPVIGTPNLPIMSLFTHYVGFQNAVVMMWKHQEAIDRFLHVLEENHLRRYVLIKAQPFAIVNIGANMHHDLCNPRYFEKYALPHYLRVTKMLRAAGKFTSSHWDGRVKMLLPYLQRLGLDGLECVTPTPMGDVTLGELKAAMGDMVLTDGMPANHFLPWVPPDELRRFTLELLDTFTPNLIAGISDMLPPNGDIEQVRFVGKIVNSYEPRWDAA
jgi:hypothetical protein